MLKDVIPAVFVGLKLNMDQIMTNKTLLYACIDKNATLKVRI